MAAHRAPRPSVMRPLARGVTAALPVAGRALRTLAGRTLRGARRASVVVGQVAWHAARTLAALTLAGAWVALLLLLVTLSLAMGRRGGAAIREGVVRDMLQPLGEGAREALSTMHRAPATRRHGRVAVMS